MPVRHLPSLLRLGQADLAARAHLSVVTIRRIENAESIGQVAPATFDGVRRVLEQAGAEFIADGVRMRPNIRPDAESRYDRLRAISVQSAEEMRGHILWTNDDLYDENGLPK